MKTSLTIFFTIFIRVGFSQTNPDSLQLQKSDSALFYRVTDSISIYYLPNIPHYTSYADPIYLSIFMPNCSDLITRDGLFYFGQDSLPYCGYCTVLQNGEKNSITYYEYSHTPTSLSKSLYTSQWSGGYFTNQNGAIVKIISSYKNGQRDGRREYYKIDGELYRIEIYKNGRLESTHYID